MRIAAAAVGLAGVWLSGLLVETAIPEHARRPSPLEAPSAEAGASLGGQVRTNLADYFWEKTEEYVHGGVLLRPITVEENAEGVPHADCGHETLMTTVIPPADHDPRGFWGDIEREVKPYYELHGHTHRDPEVTAPLYRLMTWADPTFVPGYVIGAFVIRRSDTDSAIDYLREGLRLNPRSVAIKTELGRCLMADPASWPEAEKALHDAIRLSWGTGLPDWDVEAIQDAYRWLVLLYREAGRIEEARDWARRGLRRFPDDPVLSHTLTTAAGARHRGEREDG